MTRRYYWKAGSHHVVDAEVAGSALDAIVEKHGGLTPALVVDESRAEDAPLHPEFEWDDRTAAESWRREQAKYIIRTVAVRVESSAEEPVMVRAFVSIARPLEAEADEEGGATIRSAPPVYVRTLDALADKALRRQVLERALKELDAWRRKYSDLEELAAVFESAELVRHALELEPVA